MTHSEYETACLAAREGEELLVENTSSHVVGRVVGCTLEHFSVRVGAEWRFWAREECTRKQRGTGRR